jgi:HD-GYP domain-containing protein (c-di-GMP phosphodiesterase class II)
VATYPDHGESATELLHLADGALFSAKENGKGRVVAYDPLRVPDLSARERIERLERNSRISAVRALAAAVDARYPDSRSHAEKVAALVGRLGHHLGLSDEAVRALELLAVVHDVGQIAVSDAVLKKPGSLSPSDWEQMRRHPEHGQRILASTGLTELVPAVRSHHERWDGAGYPDGLAGTEIPYEARVLALCDAYETMLADHEHRPAMSEEDAQREIMYGAGTQFDPELAAKLLEMLGADPGTISIGESAAEGRAAVQIRLRPHSAAPDAEPQRT